ncbi:MAG: glycosyltransferase family 39 protein, partial [Polyangiaceae bacterium]
MNDLSENEVKDGQGAPPPRGEDEPTAAKPAESVPPPAAPTKKRWWDFGRSERPTPALVGNPLHPVRGTLIALGGGFISFVLMALEAQFRWGVPVGLVGVVIAAAGVLDFMGTFDEPEERVVHRATMADLRGPLVKSLGSLLLTLLFIGLTAAGRLPLAAAEVLVTASFIAFVVSVFQTGVALGPWALDETGHPRPLGKREGFWVVLTGTLLYLP